MYQVSVKGIGSYTPNHVVTNSELSKVVDTSDEWIRSRTGICERRISTDENTSELAYQAAVRALHEAQVTPGEIELIVCATLTPDAFTPATACIVQDRLGAKHAVAFDINAACTGLIYGIATAMQFLQTGMYRNAVVIGAETLSKIVDWNDRNTCVLFGDGAGAVYLERGSKDGRILDVVLSTDGSKRDMLQCDAMPMRGESIANQTIRMLGGDVFKFAVKAIVLSIQELLKKQHITMEEVDWIVPHQANTRILESAAKLLQTDSSKFYRNLDRFGNTSSASIGIALDELYRSGNLVRGQKIILVGFGGGMTSGAILIEW